MLQPPYRGENVPFVGNAEQLQGPGIGHGDIEPSNSGDRRVQFVEAMLAKTGPKTVGRVEWKVTVPPGKKLEVGHRCETYRAERSIRVGEGRIISRPSLAN